MVVRYNKIVLVIVAVLFASSCTSELNGPDYLSGGKYSINASISGDTKTSLSGYKVLWSENDNIELFGKDDHKPSYYKLESGAGTSKGVFSGNSHISSGFAKYPFRVEDTCSDGVITTYLDGVQEYIYGSFSPGASPMAAYIEDGQNINFHSLCAVLKVSIVGKDDVESIVISSSSEDVKLSGEASISFDEHCPRLKMHTSAESYLTLNCNCSLSEMELTDFYCVVPPQKYTGGIQVTVNSPSGSICKTIPNDPILEAGMLYSMAPFELVLNGGLSPSTSLFGEGNESSPFIIDSVEDLLCLQDAANKVKSIISATTGNEVPAISAYYQLSRDLDLSVCCGPELGSWYPIGTPSKTSGDLFSGHFDGNGHKITGLYISNDHIKGGLFHTLYSGGYIRNLDVTGDVCGEDVAILCGSNYGDIDNCISRGKVVSYCRAAAGMIYSCAGNVKNSINYADVSVMGNSNFYYSVGGICGHFGNTSDKRMVGCINYGTIRCEGIANAHVAGIAARSQQSVIWSAVGIKSEILNCINYGDIFGPQDVGGITADMLDFRVANCVNYGNLYVSNSTGFCGGICGVFSDPFAHFGLGSTIINCINLGNVTGNGTLSGICASNVNEISNCYWLYDEGIGVPSGVEGGKVTNVVPLSKSQMMGLTASTGLYGDAADPVNALNSWAFENYSSSNPYSGWEHDSGGKYPSLTGIAPVPTEGAETFLSVNPQSITINTLAQSLSVSVLSSTDISIISYPDWVHDFSVTEEDGRHYKVGFNVEQNKSGDQRQGIIELKNEDGLECQIELTQRYSYHSDDYSRDGNVVNLQTHTAGNGIDLVFFGDGYTDKDIQSGILNDDIKRGVEAFFSVEPYASFRNLFNVKYVELVSASNSFSEDSQTALSTYFGGGTLVGGDDETVIKYCRQVTGKTELQDVTAIVIVNARRYAGTCWMYHDFSTDYALGFSVSYFGLGITDSGMTSMEATLRHEACGHGFGKLADEYAYFSNGRIPESEIAGMKNLQDVGWFPNVDFTSDPFSIRWTKFIQDDRYSIEKINVYEGAGTYWYGIYRPTQNSIMRENSGKFNAPSREAIYYKIHKLAYGDAWEYDYNAFLEYDTINRVASTKSRLEDETFDLNIPPLHPPIIIHSRP